jgi:hypothetical protein
MFKNLLTAFLVISAALVLMTIGTNSPMLQNLSAVEQKVEAQSASAIPDHILYDQMFRLEINFKTEAEKQRIANKPVSSLVNYFKDEAGLTEEEGKILEQVSRKYLQEVAPVDTEARKIISQIREEFKYGEVPVGQQVPPPPDELSTLQAKRNEIVLLYRENLKNALGDEGYRKINQFATQKFPLNFRAVETQTQK